MNITVTKEGFEYYVEGVWQQNTEVVPMFQVACA
jgi:hypothetical protein